MADGHFMTNGQNLALTMNGYKDWFARNQRIGTIKSSVMEYCVGKLLTGLETAYGALYRVGSEDSQLTEDGISVDLRWTEWYASTSVAARDAVSFRLCFGRWPDVVLFGLHDNSERYHPILDLDAWDFYAIQGKSLSEVCNGADRISLPALLMLSPVWSDYNGIPEALWKALDA